MDGNHWVVSLRKNPRCIRSTAPFFTCSNLRSEINLQVHSLLHAESTGTYSTQHEQDLSLHEGQQTRHKVSFSSSSSWDPFSFVVFFVYVFDVEESLSYRTPGTQSVLRTVRENSTIMESDETLTTDSDCASLFVSTESSTPRKRKSRTFVVKPSIRWGIIASPKYRS